MKSNRLLNRVSNLRGLGTVASVQLPGAHTQFCQRGVIRWLKAGRLMLGLAGALVATASLSPSSHAGIIYDLNPTSATVYPGGTVSVGITVRAGTSLNWLSTGFTMTWDSGVLSLQTPLSSGVTLGSMFAGATAPLFDSSAGKLVFSWNDENSAQLGIAVGTGDTLLTLNFQAVGGWENYGHSTSLNASAVSPVVFTDYSSTSASFSQNGTITVVPEPINWALGLFACVFIGSATVRWVSRRRTSLQSL
jgi:hypothetical protein